MAPLFFAYFAEGELLSGPAALTRLAVSAALPEGEATEVAHTERFAEDVRMDETSHRERGDPGGAVLRDRPRDRRLRSAGPRGPVRFLEAGWERRQAA